jgi:predicted  nucleic acid-binding Zn-ribbon protein
MSTSGEVPAVSSAPAPASPVVTAAKAPPSAPSTPATAAPAAQSGKWLGAVASGLSSGVKSLKSLTTAPPISSVPLPPSATPAQGAQAQPTAQSQRLFKPPSNLSNSMATALSATATHTAVSSSQRASATTATAPGATTAAASTTSTAAAPAVASTASNLAGVMKSSGFSFVAAGSNLMSAVATAKNSITAGAAELKEKMHQVAAERQARVASDKAKRVAAEKPVPPLLTDMDVKGMFQSGAALTPFVVGAQHDNLLERCFTAGTIQVRWYRVVNGGATFQPLHTWDITSLDFSADLYAAAQASKARCSPSLTYIPTCDDVGFRLQVRVWDMSAPDTNFGFADTGAIALGRDTTDIVDAYIGRPRKSSISESSDIASENATEERPHILDVTSLRVAAFLSSSDEVAASPSDDTASSTIEGSQFRGWVKGRLTDNSDESSPPLSTSLPSSAHTDEKTAEYQFSDCGFDEDEALQFVIDPPGDDPSGTCHLCIRRHVETPGEESGETSTEVKIEEEGGQVAEQEGGEGRRGVNLSLPSADARPAIFCVSHPFKHRVCVVCWRVPGMDGSAPGRVYSIVVNCESLQHRDALVLSMRNIRAHAAATADVVSLIRRTAFEALQWVDAKDMKNWEEPTGDTDADIASVDAPDDASITLEDHSGVPRTGSIVDDFTAAAGDESDVIAPVAEGSQHIDAPPGSDAPAAHSSTDNEHSADSLATTTHSTTPADVVSDVTSAPVPSSSMDAAHAALDTEAEGATTTDAATTKTAGDVVSKGGENSHPPVETTADDTTHGPPTSVESPMLSMNNFLADTGAAHALEVESYKKQVAQRDASLVEKEKLVVSLQSRIAEVTSQAAHFQTQAQKHAEDFKKAQSTIAAMNEELKTCRGKANKAVEEADTAKAALASAKNEMGEARKRIEGLQKQLQQTNAVLGTTKADLDETRKELQKANEKGDAHADEAASKGRQLLKVLAAAEEAKKISQTAYDDMKRAYDGVVVDRDRIATELREASLRVDSLSSRLLSSDASHSSLASKLAEQECDVGALRTERDDLRAALATATTRLAEREAAEANWKEKGETAQVTRNVAVAEAEAMRARASEMSKTVEILSKEKGELHAALDRSNAELNALKQSTAGLEAKVKKFTASADAAKSLQTENASLKETIDGLTAERNAAQRKAESLRKDVARMTGASEELKSMDIEALVRSKKSLEEKVVRLSAENAALKEQIDASPPTRGAPTPASATRSFPPSGASHVHSSSLPASPAIIRGSGPIPVASPAPAPFFSSFSAPPPSSSMSMPHGGETGGESAKVRELQRLANTLLEQLAEKEEFMAQQKSTKEALAGRIRELEHTVAALKADR